jgi:hypothetical protein
MLTNKSKRSTQLTNKESWHFDVVVNHVTPSSVGIQVNQNQTVMKPNLIKSRKMNKGLLFKKQYPFNQNTRQMKNKLRAYTRPSKP